MKRKDPNAPKVEIRRDTAQDWRRVAETIKASRSQRRTSGKR